MTEDEAKTKWCPLARSPQVVPIEKTAVWVGGTNRDEQGTIWQRNGCIASGCMAWRWKVEQTNKQPNNMASWPMVEPIYRQTEHGFCGLAGGFHA